MDNDSETQNDERSENDTLCNENMNAMPNGIETQNDERINNVNNCNNDTILSFYVQCQRNCKIGLLNIKSLRHKFYPIMNMLHNQYLDILMLQETKLDDSFPNV